MIEGVKYYPLRKFPDERGVVWHMMKKSDEAFTEFAEIYFTSIYKGVIKAWHIHKKMDLNYACMVGRVKVVLHDNRKNSKTNGATEEYWLGEDNYALLHIPHGVANGMMGISKGLSIIANCATLEHDPQEMLRVELSDVDYNWQQAHR